ncbi:MAG TPA: DUF255 domain-containing protein [Tepidisphaeraceae bacterium]|nr:DUF255 domain-containing protein [Tepidisphaeraceae bacterium]
MRWIVLGVFLIGVAAIDAHADAPATNPTTDADLLASGISWQDWSSAAFEQAANEHKLVLLHLGAGWCHWCHVMEHETYRDPKVGELIKAHFVAIHVDQDGRPDLANRYEDYGWPATILFDASGKELVKWRGYIPPEKMRAILQATIDDPTPGPSAKVQTVEAVAGDGGLSAERKSQLVKRFDDLYDPAHEGWGTIQKFLEWDALEYEMNRAVAGNTQAEHRVKATLAQTRKIIDPVWGGIYQYSTDGDWDHPHFEKIMQFQAESMRTYARAYSLWHDEADLASAKAIDSFLENFLRSPEGVFYTSEDADVIPGEHSAGYFALDDAGRRKIGLPRVDKHIFARENGWAVRGLVALYAATGDANYLSRAKDIATWVETHRALAGGGFHHDEVDVAGPYLGDNLAMVQAYLSLYQATGQSAYLKSAKSTLQFIDEHFNKGPAGFVTSQESGILSSTPEFDENVSLARASNLLYQYTGDDRFKKMSERALKYVTAPAISDEHFPAPTLLAADEVGREPMHVTIVGSLDDPAAIALHQTALAVGVGYLRLDWYDPKAGPPARDDVQYPELSHAAAFVCANGACSAPMTQPQKLMARMNKEGKNSGN